MQTSNETRLSAKASRRDFLKVSTGAAAAAMVGPLAAGRSAYAAHSAPGETKRPAPSGGCPPEIRAALSGPWPSIRTFFTRDGEIDFDALRRHLDFMIEEAKATAVVLTWGDSLYSLLTDNEIGRVTRAVVRHVDHRALVVAADNAWWTGKTVRFAEYCVDVGADLLMVMPPDWAHSTTVDSLVAHYGAVAEKIPVMLVTNYLGKRGESFGLELIRRLRDEVPGVVALKDDVGGPFARKLCLLAHDRWALSAGGQKQNHMNMHPYGVGGYLSTFMTFKPEIARRYWDAIRAGDLDRARAVIRDYDMPLFDYLIASEGSFDAALHGIFELRGFAKRYRRSPYHSLTDEQMEALAEFLAKTDLL